MATDYNPFYIMDSNIEMRMHRALHLAIEMAKDTYPHLLEELESTKAAYTKGLEMFIGSQNKPVTHPAYLKK